jgi:hypothetical protein
VSPYLALQVLTDEDRRDTLARVLTTPSEYEELQGAAAYAGMPQTRCPGSDVPTARRVPGFVPDPSPENCRPDIDAV